MPVSRTGAYRHKKSPGTKNNIVLRLDLSICQTGFQMRIASVRGHPFMTSTQREEGVRLRWTHVDGASRVKPYVDIHTEN